MRCKGVAVGIEFTKKLGTGLFGGEGLFFAVLQAVEHEVGRYAEIIAERVAGRPGNELNFLPFIFPLKQQG